MDEERKTRPLHAGIQARSGTACGIGPEHCGGSPQSGRGRADASELGKGKAGGEIEGGQRQGGKPCIYIFPSKAAQRNIRRRIKYFTKRRAAITPAEFVEQVNQTVRGWVNYFRHTNASDAFRRLQRFINIRFRRFLNFRSKGRGFGWKKYPNAALYARGIIYIGSRVVEYQR